MDNYFKDKINEIETEKQKLRQKEESINELIDTWNFFKSDKSKKHIHFPTLTELMDYDLKYFNEDGEVIKDYKNLDYDLEYFKMLSKEIEKYDFFIPCPLFNDRKIKPKDIGGMRISDVYVDFIHDIYNRLKEAKELRTYTK